MATLITGCSTGFGRLLAQRLIEQGENVIVTARNPDDIADIGVGTEEQVVRAPLDVTNDLQVDEAVAAGLEKFGSIDTLVNNAGYGYFATQEEATIDEIRKMFEVNVFGLVRVSKAVIPHMRRAKSGLIVNVSSMAGRMATPRGGFYQASKWGVEAISEVQYLELSTFGVRVAVIEPGAYETDFGPRSAKKAAEDDDPASPYAELRPTWSSNAQSRLFPHRQNPEEVVDAILAAMRSDVPFQRIPVGQDAVRVIAERDERGMDPFVEWMRGVYHDDNPSEI